MSQAADEPVVFMPSGRRLRNLESWQEAGSPTAMDKANRIWKDVLAAYGPPPLDPAIAEELSSYVARRRQEGGQKTDF